MSTALAAWNRLATALLGVGLLLVGAATVIWGLGLSVGSYRPPQQLDTSSITRFTDEPWWPWAAALVGLVAIVLALRWLAAQVPARTPHRLALAGSDAQGRLGADLGSVLDAAADRIAALDGVSRCRATLRTERGRRVVDFVVSAPSSVRPDALATAAGSVLDELATMLGDSSVPARVRLKVTSGSANISRVR